MVRLSQYLCIQEVIIVGHGPPLSVPMHPGSYLCWPWSASLSPYASRKLSLLAMVRLSQYLCIHEVIIVGHGPPLSVPMHPGSYLCWPWSASLSPYASRKLSLLAMVRLSQYLCIQEVIFVGHGPPLSVPMHPGSCLCWPWSASLSPYASRKLSLLAMVRLSQYLCIHEVIIVGHGPPLSVPMHPGSYLCWPWSASLSPYASRKLSLLAMVRLSQSLCIQEVVFVGHGPPLSVPMHP